MADSKITALTSIGTSTDPANDPLVIVDVSDTSMAATGTTKKVTLNNLLACSPTATLASATITGDLTVDTSTLKVDSATNNVGINQTNPSAWLVNGLGIGSGSGDAGATIYTGTANTGYLCFADGTVTTDRYRGYIGYLHNGDALSFGANAIEQYRIAPLGVFSWYDGAGGTRMTLNSTGLGVGGSPSYKFHVAGSANDLVSIYSLNTNNSASVATSNAFKLGYTSTVGTHFATFKITEDGVNDNSAGLTIDLPFGGVESTKLTITSSGNVGVGVTPSAWVSSSKAIDMAGWAAFGYIASSAATVISNNTYKDSASNWVFKNGSNAAGYFEIAQNLYRWWQAPAAGGAGTSGTFTQAMTLDASGNLLVGTTSAAGVRLDVQTTTGNCIGRVKSNAAASTASFIIDYVETLGCTYIKKAGSDVWIYGVQNDTSATPNFKINTASNVGVQLVAGATAWTTLSDETVKDIIEPITNAITKVGSLRSVIGKFKTDSEGTRRSFLIAQDVKSVLPEAVDVVGENNELGLRYTEVIPLLVAAIKELTARVQTLEAR